VTERLGSYLAVLVGATVVLLAVGVVGGTVLMVVLNRR